MKPLVADSRARLVTTCLPSDPSGVVIVMHGGGSRDGQTMVSRTQPSVLRMVPVARRIARAGRGRLAVFRLLNSARGWDMAHTPVDDARWALGQIRLRIAAPLPTALVGHSLGARAALLAASEPEVRSVVALAPYVYGADGAQDLTGRSILFVHGMRDRVASPSDSAGVARCLGRTAEVGYVRVADGTHALLRHRRLVDGYAAQHCVATLVGDRVTGPVARGVRGRLGGWAK